MKLHGVEPERACQGDHVRRQPVHEDSHGLHSFGKLPSNFGSLVFFDMTRTFRIEIEAQQIGARVDGRLGVGGSGDAANLYANHSAYFPWARDRKSTRLNSSHGYISYAVFCLKTKKT